MNDVYPSTKALSVYNALSICGRDMTRDEIVTFLRSTWDADVDDAYVDTGIEFLVARDLAMTIENLVTVPGRDPATRRGRPLARTDDDRELVIA